MRVSNKTVCFEHYSAIFISGKWQLLWSEFINWGGCSHNYRLLKPVGKLRSYETRSLLSMTLIQCHQAVATSSSFEYYQEKQVGKESWSVFYVLALIFSYSRDKHVMYTHLNRNWITVSLLTLCSCSFTWSISWYTGNWGAFYESK